MSKKTIANFIITACSVSLFCLVLYSGFIIGFNNAQGYYEYYQSERDAIVKSMLNGTNDSYDEITQRVDVFMDTAYS